MLRRSWLVLFCLLVATLFCIPAQAQPAQTLRVGVSEMPGLFEHDADGYYYGRMYNCLESLGVYGEFKPEYVVGTPQELYRKLQAGDIDFLGTVTTFQAQAMPDVQRSVMPSMYINCSLYLRNDLDPYKMLADVPHQHDVTIGYVEGLYNATILQQSLDEYTLPLHARFRLRRFATLPQMNAAMDNRELDGAVLTAMNANPSRYGRRIKDLFIVHLYIGLNPNHPKLCERLELALAGMSITQAHKSMAATSSIRWKDTSEADSPLMVTKPTLIITPREREFLRRNPNYRVALYIDNPPYSYVEEGEVKGIYVDYLDRVTEHLGINFDLIPTKTYQEALELVRDGKADLMPNIAADYNFAYKYNMYPTASYLQTDYSYLVRRSDPVKDFSKCKVALVKDFLTNNQLKPYLSMDNVRVYDNMNQCVRALRDGEVDIIFARMLALQGVLNKAENSMLRTSGVTVLEQSMSLGVSRRLSPMLVRVLDRTVAHIGESGITDIINKESIKMTPSYDWKSYVYTNPLPIIGVFLVLSALVGAVLFYRQRQTNYKSLYKAAYHDYRSNAHNLHWFEDKLPELVASVSSDWRKDGRLYVSVSLSHYFDELLLTHDWYTLARIQGERMTRLVERHPYMLAFAVSGRIGQSYVLHHLPEGLTLDELAQEILDDSPSSELHFGVVQIPPEGEIDTSKLLAAAELAMGEAERTGAKCCLYTQELIEKRQRQQLIEELLIPGMEREEFQVWLQPKYDIREQKTIGAEALVRWQSAELGFLMPGAFIGVFEMNHSILDLDYYMLEHVMQYQRGRMDAGLPTVPISVNQSGEHITEPFYLERMKSMKDKYALPDGLIELELTETAFVNYSTQSARQEAADIIAELRAMGYRISMDDFCTGYSSIAMLQTLPIDTIKIDRMVLLAAEKSDRGRVTLNSVVRFGHNLQAIVLCEGIETKEQEQLLIDANCPYGQGFLFGKPMPLDKFDEFLLRTVNGKDEEAV